MSSLPAIYNIKQLWCTYSGAKEDTVLFLENLSINRSGVFCVLGRSGAGKSTLIETLGLMTHTITPDSAIHFIEGADPLQIAGLWTAARADYVADLRNRCFSFLFQSNNLMPGFSALENIALPAYLQGQEQQQVYAKAMDLCALLGLPENTLTRKTQELSGGQRQRLTFVRALCKDFKILFCDEPTGNLDPITADKLMALLRLYIHQHHKLALVVTHDISLALRYADEILVLEQKDRIGYGSHLSLFRAEQDRHRWMSGAAVSYSSDELRNHIIHTIG